jgi:hypothetical protein
MMNAHSMKTYCLASKAFYFLMSSVGIFQFAKYTAHFKYANFTCFIVLCLGAGTVGACVSEYFLQHAAPLAAHCCSGKLFSFRKRPVTVESLLVIYVFLDDL